MSQTPTIRPAIALAEALESPIRDVVLPVYAALDLLVRKAADDPGRVAESRIIDTSQEADLAELMRGADLSVRDLADASGVSSWTIRRLLSGQAKNPTDRTIYSVASVFGVDPSSLRAAVEGGAR